MKRLVLCSLVLLLSAVDIASAGQKVSLCGTEGSQELLRIIGAAFEKANPGVSVEVPDGIGNDGGIKAAAAGECDFGRISRTLTNREKDLKLTYRVFALLPVVFVVDPAVGIENLSSKQIVGIFSGKVVAWTEIGGTGGKIAVVNRGADSPSRGVLNNHIKGFKEIANPAGAAASKLREAVDLLSKTPDAIGYLPASAAKG